AQTAPLQRQEEEEEAAQTAPLQRQEEEEAAQTAPLQREAEEEEEPLQTQARTHRRARVSRRFESDLGVLRRSGGAPLPDPLRSFFEPRFGRDFGSVRVHTGPKAHALASAVRARAFTVGPHIVFGPGQFQPGGEAGRRLIAHELTHVLQQKGGLHRVQREIETHAATATAAARGLQDRPSLDALLARFGLDGPEAAPPAILTIVTELLRRTLLDGRQAAELAVFDEDAATAAALRRTIETPEYRLVLEARRTGATQETAWSLHRVAPEQTLFARRQRVPGGGAPDPSLPPLDEARLALTLPTGAAYAEDPAVAPPPPAPTEAGTRPATDREAAGGMLGADPPVRASAPSPTPPVESEALAAVDAGAAEAQADQDTGADAASGARAGSDDPQQVRPPIDEAPGTEAVPDEPEPDAPADVQRKAEAGGAGGTLAPGLAREVAAVTGGGGRPLAHPVRRFMEQRLGADLGRVRLHDDARAHQLARALRARAFTRGEHIVLRQDNDTDPQAGGGLRLLAHELSHLLQQRRDALRPQGDRIQRQDEDCPPPDPVPEVEVAPSPASPAEDPAFRQAKGRVKNRAADQARHGDGADKSAVANAAAEVTEAENRLHGQTDQVGTMDAQAQNPPAFDKQAFVQKVLDEVAKTAPATMDAFLKWAKQGKAAGVKSAVTTEVGTAQEKSQGPLAEAAEADPGPGQSPRQPGTLTIEPPGPEPGSVRADRAMPPQRTDSEIDMRADTVRTQNILKEACVTRDFMDKHDDPELKSAASMQDSVEESAAASPQQFRTEEKDILAKSRAGASAKGREGVTGLFADRDASFGAVGDTQLQTKDENQAKRDAASAKIDTLFKATQTKVTTRLTKLETDVNTAFDTGANAAVKKFERDMDAEAKRHKKSWLETLADWLFDPPPKEQKDFYEAGRKVFIADMRLVIEDVAKIVETGLADARKLVETGKTEVQAFIDGLGSELEDFKQQQSEQLNDKFRSLESTIDQKQGALVKGLAQRYVKALEAAQAAEQRIREAHKNLLEKAADVYTAVKDAVVGWIAQLSAVVGGAARKIIHDPGKFLRNLGAGVVQGFTMFMENIGENIKNGVVSWLTGNLGSGGIQVPTSFDAKGLIGFLLDLVGLGVANIKTIARKVFGRTVVAAIEKGMAGAEKIKAIFDILSAEGPSGLFKYLQGEFARMKDEVMGGIGKALAESLVVAGIKKVLGIVSGLVSGGVGTVVTIVATIVDVVLWLRDNAAQIAELVGTIASMAKAVFDGQVAALASAINGVLIRLLPLVLGFVGALVGIAGAIRKIQKIFKAIRKPATKAITALFRRFKALADKLLKKLRKKKGKGKGKDKKLSPTVVRRKLVEALEKPSRQEDPAKALAETRQLAASLKAKYQPQLKKGTIRITIQDKTAEAVARDNDIDLEVALSPGTHVERKTKVKLVSPMPVSVVRFLDKSHKSAWYQDEYHRQLRDQEAGINAILVEDWKKNRKDFDNGGRDSSSATEQRKFREQFEKKMLGEELKAAKKELKAQGIPADQIPDEALKLAEQRTAKFMKENVALHDPDQVAGGSPDAIKRMGLKRINSSIGSQWRTRVGILDKDTDQFLKQNGDPKTNMNVKLKAG
ncbi:eCIS core domain-containing protein, partial [Roseospira navarrensis]